MALRRSEEEKTFEISILRRKNREICELYQCMQRKFEDASKLQSERASHVIQVRQEEESEREKGTLQTVADTYNDRIKCLEAVAASEEAALACQSNSDVVHSDSELTHPDVESFAKMKEEVKSLVREKATLWTMVDTCNDRIKCLEADKDSLDSLLNDTQEEHERLVLSMDSRIAASLEAALACQSISDVAHSDSELTHPDVESFAKMKEEVKSLVREKGTLQTMMDTCNDRIKCLEVDKDSLDRLLNDIQEDHKHQLLSVESKVVAAEEAVLACQSMLDTANSTNASIRADVENLETSLTATKTLKEELERKVDKLESKVEAVEAERVSLESRLASCKESLIEMERSCSERIEQANLKCTETEQELVRVSSVKENSAIFAHREIEKLKKELRCTEIQREEMKEALEEMIERCTLLENDLSSVEQDRNSKDVELSAKKEEYKKLLAERDATHVDLEKSLEELKAKFEVAVSTKASLQNYVSSLVHDVKVKETTIETLSKDLAIIFPKKYSNQSTTLSFQAKLQLVVDHLRESLQKKEEEVENLRILLEKKQQRIEQLQTSESRNAEEVGSLNALIREKQEGIKHLDASLDHVQTHMHALAKKNEKLAAVLADFKAHANHMNSTNNELNNMLDMYKSRCTELEKSLAEANAYPQANVCVVMQPPFLEQKQEKREGRSQETTNRNSQHSPELSKPETAEIKRLTQARKNWEALKREKALREEAEKASEDDRPTATILQDDEYFCGRNRRSVRRPSYKPRIVSPEK